MVVLARYAPNWDMVDTVVYMNDHLNSHTPSRTTYGSAL